jgi:hypothetical protein
MHLVILLVRFVSEQSELVRRHVSQVNTQFGHFVHILVLFSNLYLLMVMYNLRYFDDL